MSRIVSNKDRMLTTQAYDPTTNGESLSALARLYQLARTGNVKSGLAETSLPFYSDAGDRSQQVVDKDQIVIRGAKQHNLKSFDISIPKHKLVVITGMSGSGKSSLAFDTIFAEGQRRYVENISPFLRHYIEKFEKPQVDFIGGINPTIAIEQKALSQNPRSSVGTITEIIQHLRLLFSRVGVKHCLRCGFVIHELSSHDIATYLSQLEEDIQFKIKVAFDDLKEDSYKQILMQEYISIAIDGIVIQKEHIPTLHSLSNRKVELTIDDIKITREIGSAFINAISNQLRKAWRIGNGQLIIEIGENDFLAFSTNSQCSQCGSKFPLISSQHFNAHTPNGMCKDCNGLGTKLEIDPQRLVHDPELSILDGAIETFGNVRKNNSIWRLSQLKALADPYNIDLNTPWRDLPQDFQRLIIFGGELHNVANTDAVTMQVKGVVQSLSDGFRNTKSDRSRNYYASLMLQQPCVTCNQTGLCAEALAVTLGEKTIHAVGDLSLSELKSWLDDLLTSFTEEQRLVGRESITGIYRRLQYMFKVGLAYLTPNRPAPTLSGGEGQRMRLATHLSSELVDILYVLDEPSIGLHPRDTAALVESLLSLRDRGNSVIVVEHDLEIMSRADWLIDIGPGAGLLGGRVIATGSLNEIKENRESLTGRYLSGELKIGKSGTVQRQPTERWLTLKQCTLHNLQQVTVNIPLGLFVSVTGVSGSGKSSLINGVLYPCLNNVLQRESVDTLLCNEIQGFEAINKVINVTQQPIGRTPRSNPATYTGVFDDIRKIFASMPEAKKRHYKVDRFSFNMKGGRCETCQGYGQVKVEMHFLNDVWVLCNECQGKRFNDETLQITYKGKNILDVLEMDIQTSLDFFEEYKNITQVLRTLRDVGLEYLKLGQSAITLSGGEAQRIKLAKELSAATKGHTLYILDEPTTGLHFADIDRLLIMLQRLVDDDNTVLVIEHNLDVIKATDWVIDLGPEGGNNGGEIIAQGSPKTVAAVEKSITGHYLNDSP